MSIHEFTDDEVRNLVPEVAAHAAGKPVKTFSAGGTLVDLYAIPERPMNLGPGLVWVARAQQQTVGAGVLERDIIYEEECEEEGEKIEAAWTEQAAYVLPEYQRSGLYSTVLRELHNFTGTRIFPDSQQSSGARAAWCKAGFESILP